MCDKAYDDSFHSLYLCAVILCYYWTTFTIIFKLKDDDKMGDLKREGGDSDSWRGR